MKTFIFIFLVGVNLLFSCQIDGSKKVDRGRFNFTTGDDTELFFKNMRQSYYDLEEKKEAQINVFRFRNRSTDTDRPVLNLAIVHQYVNDQAFILLERNEWFKDQQAPLFVEYTNKDGATAVVKLERMNRDSMLEFASRLYEEVQKGASFAILVGEEKIPVLESQIERDALRITMSDYYRLTRVFK